MFALVVAAATAVSHAQGRGGGAWSTVGGDPQRTGWVRTDPRISKDSAAKGLQLLWKRQLDKSAASLTQPVLLPNIISYKGFKALAFLGGGSDTVYSIDYDLNRMFWQTRLSSAAQAGRSRRRVPADRSRSRAPPRSRRRRPAVAGAARPPHRRRPRPARRRPARQGTPPPAGGAPAGIPPGAGSPAPPLRPALRPARLPAAPQGRGAGGGGGRLGGGRGAGNNVYAVSSTGMVHALNPQTGEDLNPPAKFTGGSARLSGPVFVDNVVYAAVVETCGSVPSGVYAINLTDNANTVTSWDARGARIAGALGPAFGADGTLYVATGFSAGDATFAHAIVALDPRTLTAKNWFTASAPFTSSPVVFAQGNRTLVAASNADGSLYVLDAASLGGADNKSPLVKSPLVSRRSSRRLVTSRPGRSPRGKTRAPAGLPPRPAGRPPATRSSLNQRRGHQRRHRHLQGHRRRPRRPSSRPGGRATCRAGHAAGDERRDVRRGRRRRRHDWDSGARADACSTRSTRRPARNCGPAARRSRPRCSGSPPSGGDSQVYVVTHDGTLYAFGMPMER